MHYYKECQFVNPISKKKLEHCYLLISVGKEHFTGNYLFGQLYLIYNTPAIKRCTVVVTCTLQRFNIASDKNISPEDAEAEARLKGNDFEKEARGIIDILEKGYGKRCDFTFVRWDQYRKDLQFEKYKKQTSKWLENENAQSAMSKTVKEFYNRRFNSEEDEDKKNIMRQNKELINKYSELFLAEEIAVIRMAFKGVIIYESGASEVLGSASSDINKQNPTTQITWVKLKFSHKKSFDSSNQINSNNSSSNSLSQRLDTTLISTSSPGLMPAPFFDFLTNDNTQNLSERSCLENSNKSNDRAIPNRAIHTHLILDMVLKGYLTPKTAGYTLELMHAAEEASTSHISPPSSPPHKKISMGSTAEPAL